MEPSKVYFCDLHTHMGDGLPNKLKRLIKKAGIGQIDFQNKFVAIKMHFGNLSFLRPNYARAVVDVVRELGGKPFITDCNTLYVGGRKNALDHLDSAYANGFNPFQTGCHTIIADGLKGLDEVEVPVAGRHRDQPHALQGPRGRGLRRRHEEPGHGRRLARGQDGAARGRQAQRRREQVHRLPAVRKDLRAQRPADCGQKVPY